MIIFIILTTLGRKFRIGYAKILIDRRNKMLIYLFAFDTVLWVMDYSWDTSSLNYNTSNVSYNSPLFSVPY